MCASLKPPSAEHISSWPTLLGWPACKVRNLWCFTAYFTLVLGFATRTSLCAAILLFSSECMTATHRSDLDKVSKQPATM